MRFAGAISAVLLSSSIVIVQPSVVAALTPSQISSIAQQITVRIDGANTGSGVIIGRQGNNYTVLTNWHVVELKGNYRVQTPDGKQYNFNHSQARQLSPDVDLAVFQFTSNQNYRVAEKGNSQQITLGITVYVAGYPQGGSEIDFRRGSISRLVTNPKDGYAFVYDVGAFPGMSGGSILDEQGKLVGIHGRFNTHPNTNATTVYGIPLKTYLSLASSAQPSAINPTPVNITTKFILAMTLTGHSTKRLIPILNPEGSVRSVAISPDGKTLASGSLDKTIKIWNLDTGEEIRTLKGHSDLVISIAISLDGKTLVSSSLDKTIKIWNLNTGQEIRTLKGHSEWVSSVVISPDGKTLASGSWDKTIKIWNLNTGQEISTLKGHSKGVISVAISPDGKTLASGSHDNTIKIWNLNTGQEISTLKGHSKGVISVAISPDGKTLASGSWDNTIKIWNLNTGQEISTLKGHSDSVYSVAFSPSGRTLASGSTDATIKIWRLSE